MNKHLLALFLVCLSISTLTGFELINVLATPAPSRNSIVEPGSMTGPCDYDVYPDGSTGLVRNCQTGQNVATCTITTIEVCLNYGLANLGSNGGAVMVEPGDYTASNTIQMFAGHSQLIGLANAGVLGISSVGSQGVSIKLANNVNKDLLQVGDPNGVLNANLLAIENAWVSNIAFDGNKANQNAGDCIHGSSWAGGGITQTTIHNCFANGMKFLKALTGGAGTGCCKDIQHNTIEFTGLHGILESADVYDFIHDNHVEKNQCVGIYLAANKQKVYYNSVLQGNAGGVGGVCAGGLNGGIFIQGVLNDVSYNYVEGSNAIGINVNAANCTIMGNLVEHSSVSASNVYNDFHISGAHNLFVGNRATDTVNPQTTRFGFEEVTGATDNIYESNYSDKMITGSWGLVGDLAGTTSVFRSNGPLNPVGRLSNSMNAASGYIALAGLTGVPVASTVYQIHNVDMLITSTGGTGVSISVTDQNGNAVLSGAATITGQYVPVGFKINFGAFSVAPTVTVFGN